MNPTAVNQRSAIGSGQASSLVVELARLEYGKVCIEPDGPIEDGVEHRQLAWSAKMPEALIHICHPSHISISSKAFEALPDECGHGTVLRSVIAVLGRPPLPLICRVRNRPEDGEKGRRRTYTMARYLVAPRPNFDPLRLFGAIDSQRMRGLTRNEIKEPLPPLSAAAPSELELDELTRLFLGQGLVYLHSGVPISIAGKIDEQAFFKLVSATYRLSFPALRPYLTAGWGVAGSLAGDLAISYATHPADNCAIFYYPDGAWTHPSRYVVQRKDVREKAWKEFLPSRLSVGQRYVDRVFKRQLGSLPDFANYDASFERHPLKAPPPLNLNTTARYKPVAAAGF